MSRANTWTNPDGLIVGFGTHSVDNNVMAVVDGGTIKTFTLELPAAASLEATGSITVASIPPQSVTIPRGSKILDANFVVTTAFAGATANLDIGTYKTDATVDDANGVDAAVDVLVIDAIGDHVECNGALVGGVASCGAVSNSDVAVVFGYDTAAFTAGAGVLTLRVVVPSGSTGGTIAA